MPISFDTTLDTALRGLFRPELGFLETVLFWVPAVIGAAVALAVAAALMLERLRSREGALGHLRRVRAELKGRRGEAAMAAVLARAGYPALHDVIVRDAWGLTQVDHVVRLPDGIAVLETKAWAGTMTGRVRDRRWLQELGGERGRTMLRNPVMQNDRHVRAVRRVVGSGVPVCGLVVSAGAARFCGELDGAVVQLDGLAARLRAGPVVACDVAGADGCGGTERDAAWRALTADAADAAAYRCGLRGSGPGSGCPALKFPGASFLLPCLLSCLASPGVKSGGMRLGGAGLRRVRAVWGLRPGLPCPVHGARAGAARSAAPRMGRT